MCELQKFHCVPAVLSRVFGRQNLLNTYLSNEVLSFQVGKMRAFFVIREVSA